MKEFVGLFFALSLILLPVSALAQTNCIIWNNQCYTLVDILGIPQNWVDTPSHFIYFFVFPFLAMVAILVGLMRTVKIFEENRGLQALIGVIIVFLMLSPSAYVTGGPTFFEIIVTNLLSVAGAVGFFVFFGMLVVGIALVGYGTIWGEYHKTRSLVGMHAQYRKQLDTLEAKRDRLQRELADILTEMKDRAMAGKPIEKLKNTAEYLRKKIDEIDDKIENLKEARRHV